MTNPLSSPQTPDTDIRRVVMLFSGGPAPAANAVIGGAATAFSRAGIEVLGMKNGYSHLINFKPGDELKEDEAYVVLEAADMEGLRTSGGIMIGTARENPGKEMKTHADLVDPVKTAPMRRVYEALLSLEADVLISMGGDDTLTTAAKFKLWQDKLPEGSKRIKIVHLPKTIDNDYKGIDFTFGYFTAVEMLATQVRNILEDSAAAGAGFVVQVMGRKAGWLAYGAAIAGEASFVISLEDIPDEWKTTEETIDPATEEVMLGDDDKPVMREIFKIEEIVKRCTEVMIAREEEGKKNHVFIIAEGVAEYLPFAEMKKCLSPDDLKALKPDSFGHFPVSQLKYSNRLGRRISELYKEMSGKEKKVNGLQFGYEVRCHRPTAFDVILGSQIGVGAYRALVEEGLDGIMVSVGGEMALSYPSFDELIDMEILRAHERLVDTEGDFHQLQRYIEPRS